MPDTYTREQIDEAKLWLTTNDTGDSPSQKRRIGFEAIVLSALDTAERERDENERKGKNLCRYVGNLMIERDRLKDDLADALDCKRGEGPTALSMIIAERDALKARAAELIKVGNSVIHIQEKRGDGEYDGYSRYLRAVKKWDALTTQVEK